MSCFFCFFRTLYDRSDYGNFVNLPFGSPYKISHENYSYIVSGSYNNIKYETRALLRVGWEAEISCFSKDFKPLFLKRIRAYDNNGNDFDIEMNFKLLEGDRYVSDGNKNTVVIKKDDLSKVNNIGLELNVISY